MSTLKKFLSLLIAFVVLLSVGLCAFAETEADYEPKLDRAAAIEKAWNFLEQIQGKSAEKIAEEQEVSVWDVMSPNGTEVPPEPLISVSADQSWDDVVQMLFDKYGLTEQKFKDGWYDLALGYYNTLTGEECYFNGEEFLISASMMKVPENMIYTDMIYNGEMDWDTEINGYEYSYLQYRSIVHSDNDAFMTLLSGIGGYAGFKEKQIPYLGDDPTELLGWNYQIDNYYTAKEIINCLKLVYNEPERFAGILENMLEAEPYNYFREYERRYPIAQKYGFLPAAEFHGDIYNSCGVVFTEEPFMIVVFTESLTCASDFLAEYCTLMCDYTNFRIADQRAADEEAEQKALETIEEKNISEYLPAPETVPSQNEMENSVEQGSGAKKVLKKAGLFDMSVTATIILIVIFIVTVLGLVLIFRYNRAGRINGFWAVMAVLMFGLCLFASVVGFNLGTVYVRTDVDPSETVIKFYQAMIDGDYATAYDCLGDYSSIGLENQPETEEGRLLYDALKDSYSFTLHGAPKLDKLEAKQTVAFRYLNLSAVESEAKKKVDSLLKKYVESHDRREIYDSDGVYLQSATDEVYLQALQEALADAEKYYTSSEYDVTLTYSDGRWIMNTNPEMLKAFLGGVS